MLYRPKTPVQNFFLHFGVVIANSLALFAFCLPALVQAQSPCGNVIGPDDYFSASAPVRTEAIADCAEPLGNVSEEVSPFALYINDAAVAVGQTVEVPESGTNQYRISQVRPVDGDRHAFYRHEGSDLVFVTEWPIILQEEDYRNFATSFFTDTAEADMYLNFLFGDMSFADDPNFNYDRLDEFTLYAENQADTLQPPLIPGTYTMLSEEFIFILTSKADNFPARLLNWFIPTAHAQFVPNPLYTMTFILSEAVPEPTGASNILFIPGIMGSKLYEQSSDCEDESEEQERWVSFDSCSQLRLQTNYLGQSLNIIYTYANESALVDEISIPRLGQGPNIYKSLLADLKAWKVVGRINDFAILPYDWRLRVDDLMNMSRDPVTNKIFKDSNAELNQTYLYETISRLAQNEKVTVVAHSNGGLLIKYFVSMLEEQNDPLLDRIENIILVAVPQEGTPESVIGTLHGVELGLGGFVMDSQTSRSLMKDGPFGFHLLPTRQYFESVATPVITIEEGLVTNNWRQQFGDSLNSYDEMRTFMIEGSGRLQPSESDVATPAVINEHSFTYKSQLESVLADWQAPEGIKVYQVAGTGIVTPSGLTYFTDIACVDRNIFFQCTRYERKLGYRVNGVLDGDGTVVTPSALSLGENEQVKRMWVNIDEFNQTNIDKMHRDIMEIEDIRNFILGIATSSTDPVYTYLSTSSPSLGNGSRLVFQLHSPLDMSVRLANGQVVGSSTEIADGATYRRFGELQYLSVPATEEDIVLKLDGRAEGSFTLDIEEVRGGEVLSRKTYSAIPTATSTRVEVPIASISEVEDLVLEVDYDGDGVADVSYNTEGVVAEEVTYEDLFVAIKELSLNKNLEKILLSTAKTAEKFYEKSLTQAKYKKLEVATLQVLRRQLEVYERIRLVTAAQREKIESTINHLISK